MGKAVRGTIESVVEDLLASYRAAELHLNGTFIDASLLSGCESPIKAIDELIRIFKERFCQGEKIGMSIYEDEGRHMFRIHKVCTWDDSWNIMECRKILVAAKKCSPALLSLTLSFIHTLWSQLHIGSWWGGGMDYAEDWLEERIGNGFVDVDDEDVDDDWICDLQSHRNGEAAAMAQMITDSPVLSADKILKRLSLIKKDHPLKDAIRFGCELLKQPYTIGDFDNPELDPDFEEENEGDPISFWEQNTIIWEFDNGITTMWQERLDSKYQEYGASFPVACCCLDPKRKGWDKDELDKMIGWPMKLHNLFRKLNDACPDIDRSKSNKKPKPIQPQLLINILT